jgi:hypothetical protein
MHGREGESWRPEGGRGDHRGCRIGAVTPADVGSSVEKFEQPGDTISRESRGETERRGRGFIGWSRCSIYC